MIKRLNKMKKSKQGSILIIVVLILALAIIFISTAMMLTQATRGRLYENTLQSQARLTVTAASEVFLEALETQEITDVQLDALLAVNGVGPKSNDSQKLRMVVEGVPGMSESDDTNCTYVDVFYKDTNKKVAVIDFKTIIGDQTENVRVYLDIKSSGASYGNRFKNQIEIGASVNDHELRFTNGVGMTDPAKTGITDNTILIRGSGQEHASGSVFYSDIVFAKDSICQFGGSNYVHGKTILIDAYMISGSNATIYYDDIYYIGNSYSDAALLYKGGNAANQWSTTNFPNNTDGTNRNWVFMNRKAEDKTQDEIYSADCRCIKQTLEEKTCYFVKKAYDTDGNLYFTTNSVQNSNGEGNFTLTNKADTGIAISVSDNLKRYVDPTYCNLDKSFPTDANTVFATFSSDGYETATSDMTLPYDTYLKDGTPVPKNTTISAGSEYEATPLTKTFPSWLRSGGTETGAIPDSYKLALTNSNLQDMADSNKVIDLPSGYYYLTPDSNIVANSDGKPYVIAIDGSQEYRFYFQTNGHFQLGTVVFAVYNVNKNNPAPVVFIMEPGAKITLSAADYRNTSVICSAGFISVQHVKDLTGTVYYDDADSIGSWIRGTAYTEELYDWGGGYHNEEINATIKYPYAYDGNRRPAAYIFGSGSNEFKLGDHCIVEAYIGLYGTGSKFGGRGDIDKNIPTFVYGRIEAAGFQSTGTTGCFSMPYCPQPQASDDLHGQKAAESKFKVNNIIYYR